MKLTKRVLHNVAKPCDFRWPHQNLVLANDMFVLMRKHNGIGLAATQVGVARRMFVMSVHGRDRACFNPEIAVSGNEFAEYAEGCLSFPGDQCILTRPETVTVKYQDHQGNWVQDDINGIEARCFQHELDHLDGITMHDRKKEQDAAKPRN